MNGETLYTVRRIIVWKVWRVQMEIREFVAPCASCGRRPCNKTGVHYIGGGKFEAFCADCANDALPY